METENRADIKMGDNPSPTVIYCKSEPCDEMSLSSTNDEIKIEPEEYHQPAMIDQSMINIQISKPESLSLNVKLLLKCNHCNFTFTQKESFDTHNNQFHKFKCRHCSKVFGYQNQLDYHLITYHECQHCDEIYKSNIWLDMHIKLEHKFFCQHCNEVFTSKKLLISHLTTISLRKRCEHCDKDFGTGQMLREHLIQRHKMRVEDIPMYACSHCSAVFQTKNLILLHQAKINELKCHHCDKAFTTGSALKNHIIFKHYEGFPERILSVKDTTTRVLKRIAPKTAAPTMFKCNSCYFEFTKQHDLIFHKKTAHAPPKAKSPVKKPGQKPPKKPRKWISFIYACEHCEIEFTNEDNLKLHTITHHLSTTVNEAPPEVPLMESSTNTNEAITVAVEPTKGDKVCIARVEPQKILRPYKCPHCEKRFEKEYPLSRHIKNVHGYKLPPHKQSHVSRPVLSAPSESSIEQDNVTTTNEATAAPEELTKEGEEEGIARAQLLRPYRCAKCDKRFAIHYHLSRHHRNEHGPKLSPRKQSYVNIPIVSAPPKVKKDNATTAKEATAAPEEMTKGAKIGIARVEPQELFRPFKCGICETTFDKGHQLSRHIRNEHVDKPSDAPPEYKCQLCTQTFESGVLLKQHLYDYHFWYQFIRCEVCDASFATENLMTFHVFKEHPESLRCKHCDQVFRSKKLLTLHMTEIATHVKCNHCDKVFATENNLKEHAVEVHHKVVDPQPKFPCDHCNVIFLTEELLMYHKNLLLILKCLHCDEYFETENKLRSHIIDDHLQEIPENSVEPPPTELLKLNPLKCEFCDIEFTRRDNYTKHVKDHHQLLCGHCKKTFTLKVLLLEHLREAHPDGLNITNKKAIERISNAPKVYSCKVCRNYFQSQALLDRHSKYLHRFPCELCDQRFDQRYELTEHMKKRHFVGSAMGKEATQLITFKCDFCKKLFKTQLLLHKHMQLMHKFQCEICKVQFGESIPFKSHMREEHFSWSELVECELCERLFQTASYLDDHLIHVHSDPVTCELCDEVLQNSKTFKQHLDEKHKKCSHCDTFFKTEEMLGIHFTSEHSFQCEVCDAKFDAEENLTQHVAEKHPMVNHVKDEEVKPSNLKRKNTTSIDEMLMFTEVEQDEEMKCSSCASTFTDQLTLDKHVKTHHVKTFDSENSLNQHLKSVQETQQLYKCVTCTAVFERIDDFQRHKESHKFMKCDHCDLNLETEKLHIQHLAEKHSIVSTIRCYICFKAFATKQSLEAHNDKLHKLPCKFCDKVFKLNHLLKQHLSDEHTVRKSPRDLRRSLNCTDCSEVFKTAELLKQHLSKVHSSPGTSKSESEHSSFDGKFEIVNRTLPLERFRCELCDKGYVNKTNFNSHMEQVHSIYSEMKCNLCMEVFTKTDKFEKHKLQPHWKKCEKCDEFFQATVSQRPQQFCKAHSMESSSSEVVSNEEDSLSLVDVFEVGKYECQSCYQVFETFHELEYHGKTHVKEIDVGESKQNGMIEVEPIRCVACEETFASVEDLEKHSKVHIKA